jgi:hypothetical protein
MKAKIRIRVLRHLAIAGSLSALAVPTSAVAKPMPEVNWSANHTAQQPYQLPARFRTEIQSPSVARQYTLPSNFHSEVQTQAKHSPQQPFNLPSGFKPEVQTPSSPTVASSPGSIIREIRTVTDDGNPTLALVLAALALAIALCGSAYAGVRLSRMQRNLSSRALVG